MSTQDRVIWSEGLFLRPQLFQQQERYLEQVSHARALPLSAHFWGFSAVEIDRTSLAHGKLVLTSAQGVFRDGTPFTVSGHASPPAPLAITRAHLDRQICLAVPLRIPNVDETAFDPAADGLVRYRAYVAELPDSNAIGQGPRPVQLGRLRLALMCEDELQASWIGLPVARIRDIAADGAVTLHDDSHIPPVTGFGASTVLRESIIQLHALLRLRTDSLASMLSGTRQQAQTEVSDYLLLLVLNRYEPWLAHVCAQLATHPEDIYRGLVMMAGELATFVQTATRRPNCAATYDHGQLQAVFTPLVTEIRHYLNQVMVRGATPIPLTEQAQHIWTASMQPAELDEYSMLVLTVGAHMPSEQLQQQFLAQSKLSAPHQLPELIRSHLPGLALNPLPVPPRELPFHAQHVYFEVVQDGAFWPQVARQGGLALHIAGSFPGLQLALWGVRKK